MDEPRMSPKSPKSLGTLLDTEPAALSWKHSDNFLLYLYLLLTSPQGSVHRTILTGNILKILNLILAVVKLVQALGAYGVKGKTEIRGEKQGRQLKRKRRVADHRAVFV